MYSPSLHEIFYCKLCVGDAGLLVVTVMPSSLSVEVTHNATFTTMVTGAKSDYFTYQWKHNGTVINGVIGDILMIINVMESNSGDY